MNKTIVMRLALVLIVVAGFTLFTGCDLMTADLQSDAASERGITTDSGEYVLASSRRVATEFTATVVVEQQSVITVPQGVGYHWKTTDEVLVGTVVSSTWNALLGASVTMNNFTNFSMSVIESGPYAGTYSVTGTNHSSIDVQMLDGEVLAMKANGTISGNIPFGAMVDMHWSTTGNTTGTKGPSFIANGDLLGSFVWYTMPPSGSFTLTGVYR